LDFLGFHHRLVRSRGDRGKPKVTFLARWPADKAMQHTRDRIREITDQRRLLLRPETIARDVNDLLRGWAGYFKRAFGSASQQDQAVCATAAGGLPSLHHALVSRFCRTWIALARWPAGWGPQRSLVKPQGPGQ
jgi:Group II intron, maturase-specific domain